MNFHPFQASADHRSDVATANQTSVCVVLSMLVITLLLGACDKKLIPTAMIDNGPDSSKTITSVIVTAADGNGTIATVRMATGKSFLFSGERSEGGNNLHVSSIALYDATSTDTTLPVATIEMSDSGLVQRISIAGQGEMHCKGTMGDSSLWIVTDFASGASMPLLLPVQKATSGTVVGNSGRQVSRYAADGVITIRTLCHGTPTPPDDIFASFQYAINYSVVPLMQVEPGVFTSIELNPDNSKSQEDACREMTKIVNVLESILDFGALLTCVSSVTAPPAIVVCMATELVKNGLKDLAKELIAAMIGCEGLVTITDGINEWVHGQGTISVSVAVGSRLIERSLELSTGIRTLDIEMGSELKPRLGVSYLRLSPNGLALAEFETGCDLTNRAFELWLYFTDDESNVYPYGLDAPVAYCNSGWESCSEIELSYVPPCASLKLVAIDAESGDEIATTYFDSRHIPYTGWFLFIGAQQEEWTAGYEFSALIVQSRTVSYALAGCGVKAPGSHTTATFMEGQSVSLDCGIFGGQSHITLEGPCIIDEYCENYDISNEEASGRIDIRMHNAEATVSTSVSPSVMWLCNSIPTGENRVPLRTTIGPYITGEMMLRAPDSIVLRLKSIRDSLMLSVVR